PTVPAPAASVPSPLPPIMLLSPTQATGSVVVPVSVPPVSGTGPSFTQMRLVIPGPNPAQNTTLSLSQLLGAILGSVQSSRAPAVSGPGAGSGFPARPVSSF